MSIGHLGRLACFGVNLCWLRQLTMLVHHFKQSLDVFIFLFCRRFFVLLELGYFLVPHVPYDLLGLLHFQGLYRPGLVDRVTFSAVVLHLWGLDHLWSRQICLLIKGILHEFLLEPKVLELLLLLAFAFKVHRVVKVSQLAHFFLLLVLHRDVSEDQVTLGQLIVFAIAFTTQKLLSLALLDL